MVWSDWAGVGSRLARRAASVPSKSSWGDRTDNGAFGSPTFDWTSGAELEPRLNDLNAKANALALRKSGLVLRITKLAVQDVWFGSLDVWLKLMGSSGGKNP